MTQITLTGTPTSQLHSVGDIFNFDMMQITNPVSKDSPMPEDFRVYTIFLSRKQWHKLSISKYVFRAAGLLVQGNPTGNIIVPNCEEKTGVWCSKIKVISCHDIVDKEVHPKVPIVVNETKIFMDIHQIVIPKPFQNSRPTQTKIMERAQSIKIFGMEKPLLLSEENVLLDGYTWYIAARRLGIRAVPVRFERIPKEKI